MIKLLLFIIFFWAGIYPLMADEGSVNDQQFMKQLDNIKSMFDDGLPKQVYVPPPVQPVVPPPVIVPKPKPKPLPPPVIVLPAMKVEGVMVGDEMHQAIINDEVVPLQGLIKGARVVNVTKDGVDLIYKGKKFFLKVE